MADYISREAAIKKHCEFCRKKAKFLYGEGCRDRCPEYKEFKEEIPAADVVARDCYDRILAENDTMRKMLAGIGKKLGDKMDNVRPVVHGAWKPNPRNPYWLDCTVCGYGKPERMVYNFCPNCGAYMEGNENG